ncbi:DNA protecting protein DprA [Pandoraea vervacti]|uniref:DNA protecting protein DprA n=1 Tax=Pandoraea vervacti TaxID=656178 RepID=A0ABN4FU21_9BURK|nr:DNA protecting protein DprA [Pandoraea vervacti]
MGASPDEIRDWLRLCHAPGVPPAAVRRLLATLGPPGAIFAASRGVLTEVVPREVVSRLLARTSAELETQISCTLAWARQPGCTVLTLSEAAYPRALLTLGDAPPILYCRGDAALMNRAQDARDVASGTDSTGGMGGRGDIGEMAAALVGSRRATPQGRENARHFARVLGDAGVTVVSGLAAGIDAAAHEGALETAGRTCAVIGTGADIVYPSRHHALAERIAERGLLLSAFPLGTPPRPEHFPRRNRLIAALARCTVVIEATTHSGSLITARLAGELGRDVLAVPGSIHAPQSRGCHVLIRDGATLVTSPEDVFEAMGIADVPGRPRPQSPEKTADSPARQGGRRRRGATGRRASVADTITDTDTDTTSDPGDEPILRDPSHENALIAPDVLTATRSAPPEPASTAGPPQGTAAVLEALGYDPVNADTLCERSGLGIAAVLSQLGALELDGLVARLPGGRFARLDPGPAR